MTKSEKERINLVEVDASKEIFKIYGILQPHKPWQMKAEISYGHPIKTIVTSDLIQSIVIFLEKEKETKV